MTKKTKTLEDHIMTAGKQYQQTGTSVAAVIVALHAGITTKTIAMSKLKTAGKKPKTATSKKVTTRNTSSAKPIKLGGVPSQGTLSTS